MWQHIIIHCSCKIREQMEDVGIFLWAEVPFCWSHSISFKITASACVQRAWFCSCFLHSTSLSGNFPQKQSSCRTIPFIFGSVLGGESWPVLHGWKWGQKFALSLIVAHYVVKWSSLLSSHYALYIKQSSFNKGNCFLWNSSFSASKQSGFFSWQAAPQTENNMLLAG